MGFYFRKSVSFGGLRVNFSKSGIGVSAGVRGFRFGMSPRGNYVHIGANGYYYKKIIGAKRNKSRNAKLEQSRPHDIPIETNITMQEIESDDTLKVYDSDSHEIINEINSKYRKYPSWPLGVMLSIILASTQYLIIGLLLIIILIILDRRRKITFIIYDIDQISEGKIQSFYDTFDELRRAEKKWHVAASGYVSDKQRKYHAGADNLIKRSSIQINYSVPKYIKTNVKVPCIPVGKQKLYFFPDRVFLVENRKVGAVSYGNLILEHRNSRFIEEETVPMDTEVVGQTWRFVNKNGGPDRRFKNNRQLPICLYSELWFKSSTGLNEVIQVSKPDVGIRLKNFLNYDDFTYLNKSR